MVGHERDRGVTGTWLCNPAVALEGRERTAAGCSLAAASAQHMPVFTTFSIKEWTEGKPISVYPDIPTGAGAHVLYSTCYLSTITLHKLAT